jgi:hypothetical protein
VPKVEWRLERVRALLGLPWGYAEGWQGEAPAELTAH